MPKDPEEVRGEGGKGGNENIPMNAKHSTVNQVTKNQTQLTD